MARRHTWLAGVRGGSVPGLGAVLRYIADNDDMMLRRVGNSSVCDRGRPSWWLRVLGARMIGHNGGPVLASRNFKRQWAAAIFAHPDKPFRAPLLWRSSSHMEMSADGSGATVSDREFCRCVRRFRAGLVSNFKRWLLERTFVVVAVRGHKGRPNTFQAIIPARGINGI